MYEVAKGIGSLINVLIWAVAILGIVVIGLSVWLIVVLA